MLLAVYGFGFAGVYLALTLLYLHAWRLRDALDLSEIEKLDTRFGIYRLSSVVVVGLIAAGLALISVVLVVGWPDLSFAFPGLARISHDPSATKGFANCGRRNIELYNTPPMWRLQNCRAGASPAAFAGRLCQTLNPSKRHLNKCPTKAEL